MRKTVLQWFRKAARQSQIVHGDVPPTPAAPSTAAAPCVAWWEPTPVRGSSSAPYRTTIRCSPEHHAESLLRWLRQRDQGYELFYADVLSHYNAMCIALNLTPHAWATVARAFTKATTGRKVFRWVRSADGTRHRLRIYPLTVRREECAIAWAAKARAAA
jgi:hypothetical protein